MTRMSSIALAMMLLLAFPLVAFAFETNGKKWPEMPIQYWINPEECPVIENLIGTEISIVDVMEHAALQWSMVSCADVSFQYMGTTDKTWEPDGQNTVYCISNPDEWSFGVGAAGATLWLPRQDEDDPMEVDLALNAAELNWVVGGGDALTADTVDPKALVTHEIGHWLGMSHTPDPFATMYSYTLPNALQMTLNGDDKAGVCSLYPNGEKECLYDEDCPVVGEFCDKIEGIRVCNETHDGPGDFCSKDHINCDQMCWVSFFECEQLCLFTVLDFSEGYCSPLCSIEHADCPDGYICTYVDEHEISVCFVDPEYVPPEPELEPGPEPTEDIIAEVAAPDQPDEIIGEEDLPIAETAPSDNGGPGDSVLEDVATSGGTKKSTSGCTASRTASASTETWLLFLAVAGCLWIRFRTDAQIHHGHR